MKKTLKIHYLFIFLMYLLESWTKYKKLENFFNFFLIFKIWWLKITWFSHFSNFNFPFWCELLEVKTKVGLCNLLSSKKFHQKSELQLSCSQKYKKRWLKFCTSNMVHSHIWLNLFLYPWLVTILNFA